MNIFMPDFSFNSAYFSSPCAYVHTRHERASTPSADVSFLASRNVLTGHIHPP